MGITFLPDFQGIKDVMALPEVTDATLKVAETIYATAHADAASQGLTDYAALLKVEQGTRPKGRTYSRVTAQDTQAGEDGGAPPAISPSVYEWGSEQIRRRRILGKAAGVAIFSDSGAARNAGPPG